MISYELVTINFNIYVSLFFCHFLKISMEFCCPMTHENGVDFISKNEIWGKQILFLIMGHQIKED